MSLYGAWKTAVITITDSVTLSAAVDLEQNFDFLDIVIPTIDSGTVALYVCPTSDGTYVALGNGVTTATTTGGYSTVFKLGGWQHIKIKTSANQTANRSFSVRGWKF
jgi:hypothetical protein